MEDVEDYVRARWNDLVRTLISLGADVVEAERTASDALVRCWSDWPDEHRSGDVDLLVYGELLALWAARSTDPPPVGTKIARVLVGGAALTSHQAEDLTGADSGAMHLGGIQPWDALYAAPAPVAALREAVRRGRRRRLGIVAGVVAAVLVIVGAVFLGVGRDSTPPTPDLPESRNAIALAWWGDDVLHLGNVEVDSPGLRVLAQAGTDPSYSVVYGDSAGQVVQVGADGTSERIGSVEVDAPVLGTPEERVVWVDLSDGDPSLILWDPTAAATVASLDLAGTRAGADARLLAVIGSDILLRTAAGAVEAWTPGDDETRPTDAPPGSPRSDVSPSGRFLVEWEPQGSQVRVRSLSPDAAELPAPELSGTRVLSARFVNDTTLVVISTRTYLLGRDYNDGVTQSGRFPVADLITCDVATGACAVSQRRAQDVDPSATESAIILAS